MRTHQSEIWIHDDPENRETYRQVFALQFSVRFFDQLDVLQDCLNESQANPPALLILDADRIESDPIEWIKLFGASLQSRSRMIVVSRNDNLEQMREFIQGGAADYLLKPLKPNELIFRCENVLSKSCDGLFEILPTTIDGVSLKGLTFKERQLLAIFVLSADRSVARSDLFGAIWKDISVNKKTLDVHLFNLRRKLHPVGFDILCHSQVYRLCRSALV